MGVCVYKFDDNFMTYYREELQSYFKSLESDTVKYNVTVVDGKNDMAEQTNQVDTFLAQGVDVLIVNLVQSSSAATITEKADAAGVPVVYINRQPSDDDMKASKNICYVGADASQSGTFQGDIVLALGISDAKMERGNLRCDANVSLRPRGSDKLGTRTETKNVNSLRSVERAVRYEIQRQAQILSEGGTIIQETRHWHEDTGATSAGRPKSDADDYRYFPEPDLLPVVPDPALIEELRAALPEKPAERRRRLKAEWGFTDLEFQDVVNSGLLNEITETVAAGATPQAARKWWTGEIARLANAAEGDAGIDITPAQVAELQQLVDEGTLTDRLARQVLEAVAAGEGSPREIVETKGLAVVSDDGALIAAIDEALSAQPDVLEKIKDGKVQAAGAVIGAVMKAMQGKADAARVRELVLERAAAL
ncbi:MAG: substrate-binding domain-containing protein [Aurantimicrobium sp.]